MGGEGSVVGLTIWSEDVPFPPMVAFTVKVASTVKQSATRGRETRTVERKTERPEDFIGGERVLAHGSRAR